MHQPEPSFELLTSDSGQIYAPAMSHCLSCMSVSTARIGTNYEYNPDLSPAINFSYYIDRIYYKTSLKASECCHFWHLKADQFKDKRMLHFDSAFFFPANLKVFYDLFDLDFSSLDAAWRGQNSCCDSNTKHGGA